MQQIPLAWFQRRPDAEQIATRLHSSGVRAEVRSLRELPDGWSLSANSGFGVWIHESQLAQALNPFLEAYRSVATAREQELQHAA